MKNEIDAFECQLNQFEDFLYREAKQHTDRQQNKPDSNFQTNPLQLQSY